jgi:hypothetical protein
VILSILVTLGALTLAGQPLNWWSRFTVWLYGVGGPPVALALDAFARRTPSLARSGGVAVCVMGLALGTLVVFEAGYTVSYAATVSPDLKLPPPNFAHALVDDGGDQYIFRDLRGPVTLDALHGEEPIGISLIRTRAAKVLGQLSHPMGKRHIVFLPDDLGSDEEAVRRLARQAHVRWVLWNSDLPASALERLAVRKDVEPSLWVAYELPQTPTF